jgi:hypothetical protein
MGIKEVSQVQRGSRLFPIVVLLAFLFEALVLVSCGKYISKPASTPDAVEQIATVDNPCGNYNSFVTNAMPVIKSSCANCHGTGGTSAGKLLLLGTDAGAAANYAMIYSKNELLSADNGVYYANPILSEPIGIDPNHPVIIPGPQSSIYIGIATWIADERTAQAACGSTTSVQSN